MVDGRALLLRQFQLPSDSLEEVLGHQQGGRQQNATGVPAAQRSLPHRQYVQQVPEDDP